MNFDRKNNNNGNYESFKNILYTFIQYIHHIFEKKKIFFRGGELTTDSLIAMCYSDQKLYKQNIFKPLKFLDCKMFDIRILNRELLSPLA